MSDGPGRWSLLVRRALAGHAAIGLLAAALLYVVMLTGTLAVIHERWQRWEQPAVPEFATLPPAAAQAAVAAAVAVGPPAAFVTLQMPGDGFPRAIVATDAGSRYVDRTGRPADRVSAGWTEFVVALHEGLLLPLFWGYALVGTLGVALSALALTGVLAHPRIVRDAFRLRWRQGPPIARVDWHNRLGVWTLPFTLAIALTGAVLGLGTIGFAVLAQAYDGGSLERAYAPLYGAQPAPGTGAAPLPDIAVALAALHAAAPDAAPALVSVQTPGRRGQEIRILATQPRRLIYGETYRFDARGRPLGRIGLSDGAIGQQAMASLYGLHFGSFGGLPVELAYLLFGAALCVVTATGPSIWLHKRRRRGLDGPRLSACWNAVVWGTPLLLLLAFWLRRLTGADAALPWFFVAGLAVLLVAAATVPAWFWARRCRTVLLSAVAATGAVHLLAFGFGAAAGALDTVLILGAGAALWALRPAPPLSDPARPSLA